MRINREEAADLARFQIERLDEIWAELPDRQARADVLRHSFYCSLSSMPAGKIAVHLMFLTNVFVKEELPEFKRLQFSILDLCWIASQNLTFLREFTLTGKDHNPGETELRKVTRRDPAAKEDFLKWRASVRKRIEESVLRLLGEETDSVVHLLLSDVFWDCLAKVAGLHRTDEKQRIQLQQLLVNYQGQTVAGGGKPLPRKSDVMRLCRQFLWHAAIPQVWSLFVWQKCPELSESPVKSIATAPLHIGWCNVSGVPILSGVRAGKTRPAPYGTALLGALPECSAQLSALLKVAPYEVTVPLFCYGIFAVIKPFIPDYPARVSCKESFSSVVRKREKLLYLSLNGPHADTLAKLFYGVFTDYGDAQPPDSKTLRLYQSRVHDGVVVLSQQFKSLEKFRSGALIRDACIVLTHSELPENVHEIRLSADRMDPEANIPALRQVFPCVLWDFLNWFTARYTEDRAVAVGKCWEKIRKQARKVYAECFSILKAYEPKQAKINQAFQRIDQFVPVSWVDLKDASKSCCSLIAEKIDRIVAKQPNITETGVRLAGNQYQKFQSEVKIAIKMAEERFQNEFFLPDSVRKEFPGKERNLGIALHVFARYIEACEPHSNAAFWNSAAQYLQQAAPMPEAVAIQTLFHAYLSGCIQEGRIALVRAPSAADCFGWYDGQKKLIYLPYSVYYEDFRHWCVEHNAAAPLSKKTFQETLMKSKVLLSKENGADYRYQRPDFRITVDPISDQQAKARNVVKIRINPALLSQEAQERLEQISAQRAPRRRAARTQ